MANQAFIPISQIELTISCTNLIDLDITSKTDSQCVVYLKDSHSEYFEVGRTEVIRDCLNPNFVKKVNIDFNFESVQYIKFELWDIDKSAENDFIGSLETTVAEIVTERCFKRSLTDENGIKDVGEINIVVEELSACKQIVWLEFKATELKKHLLSRPDPFLTFWRVNEDNSYSIVHKTSTCRSTTKPIWPKTKIQVSTLCNGDYDRSIQIICMDEENDGDHRLIGSCYTTLNQLINDSIESNVYTLNKHENKNNGTLHLLSRSVEEIPSFIDYIRNGLQMHFAVAIDFTLSNGEVTDRESLHYINPNGEPNAYEIALRAIGEIIQPYSPHSMYPGFGFGGALPPSYSVSHKFSLNGNPAHPYCNGIEELVTTYRNSLSSVKLAGPTNFAPVIRSTAEIANGFVNGSGYFVLLIITDGIISDMSKTKQEIINASKLPLSIIIIGVGDADFSAMDALDADDGPLISSSGGKAERDIVQFVPLNRFIRGKHSSTHAKANLAKEVLREIPDQVVAFMLSKGFRPNVQN